MTIEIQIVRYWYTCMYDKNVHMTDLHKHYIRELVVLIHILKLVYITQRITSYVALHTTLAP